MPTFFCAIILFIAEIVVSLPQKDNINIYVI